MSETCAACGLPRATDEDHEALAPECRTHAGCPRCEDLALCWVPTDQCAASRGGWAAVASELRARAEQAEALNAQHRACAEQAYRERDEARAALAAVLDAADADMAARRAVLAAVGSGLDAVPAARTQEATSEQLDAALRAARGAS